MGTYRTRGRELFTTVLPVLTDFVTFNYSGNVTSEQAAYRATAVQVMMLAVVSVVIAVIGQGRGKMPWDVHGD